MAISKILKKHGFSKPEIDIIKNRAKDKVNTDPFASEKDREREAVKDYLSDMKTERASIINQVEKVQKGGKS